MKNVFTLFALCFAASSLAQPATEVWIFDLAAEGKISQPVNVSKNPGYDNQPSFTRGGNQLLFTSTRNGQTDIVSYDIRRDKKSWLTSTPGSEYSPVQIPGTFTWATILLEEDGRQLLWTYSLNGGAGKILVPFVKIGYQTWLNDEEMFAFVLGPDPTFQRIHISNQRAEIIQEKIGRSLATHKEKIFFIDASTEQSMITQYDPKTEEKTAVIHSIENSQDFTISEDGYLYMGKDDQLFRAKIGVEKEWALVADLTVFGRSQISRLAISPDNSKIAIVTAE